MSRYALARIAVVTALLLTFATAHGDPPMAPTNGLQGDTVLIILRTSMDDDALRLFREDLGDYFAREAKRRDRVRVCQDTTWR